jgi:glyoxylase-like metal-dependent hydrolase (beta-lactamase superfamily II)
MPSAHLTWNIGDVKVTRVIESDGGTTPIAAILENATPDLVKPYAWLRPHFVTESGDLLLSFHAFIIQAPKATIVIDTCMGNDREQIHPALSNLKTPFLENFKATGIDPDDVDYVFCTHLHFDHVGWNTRREGDRWVPTFPKARYLFDKGELESLQKYYNSGDPHGQHYAVGVAPILEAGLATYINADGYQICDEIRLLSTPGHTAGHASVMINSQGKEAVITGDLFHTPAQFAFPEHPVAPDEDKTRGAQTRGAFAKRFADTETMVLGTHFPAPTSGWIVKDTKNWKFRV